ncbi:MAG: aspartate aminotransferase family protein [Leptolinea sp.]|nr:aspartate aminotransferase family protein [Leptolinea sp.]
MIQPGIILSEFEKQEESYSPDEIREKESVHTSGVYSKRQVTIVRGKGAHLWDADGKEYIDCVGGQGAANIGHANQVVAEAIYRQAQILVSCPEMFYNDKRAMVGEKLCNLTGMARVFLCNSGTEAVEAGIKFARLLTGRTEMIAAMRGFHGRTFGALSATWEKKYRTPFEPLVPGYKHIPYNDLDALENAITDQTAAVILEVVQGEGGVNPGKEEFLLGAREITRKNGCLLILDEVQTGFGRTGKMFAFQHFGIIPDILCLAKSIAGGIPMGACLLSTEMTALAPQTHGSTFGGNPLAASAALASIQFIEENNLPSRAAELGVWFVQQLAGIQSPLIREVRGKGLMVGVELKQKVTPFLQKLMDKGVMALPAGLTVMRFLPPLVIEKSDLEIVVTAVRDVLTDSLESGD